MIALLTQAFYTLKQPFYSIRMAVLWLCKRRNACKPKAGQSIIGKHNAALNRRWSEPAANVINTAFQVILPKHPFHIWKKGQLNMIAE